MEEACKQFNQKEIVRIIRSRLSTQDRTSGDKVWLLMRTVKRLLNSHNSKWFVDWSKDIIDQTKVLIDKDGKSITLNKVNSLILKPSEEEHDKFEVYAMEGTNKFRVYTHKTHKDPNLIIPLTVEGIGNVSLDHVKPIDTTLRELEDQNKLTELEKISKIAKIVSNDIGSFSGYRINKNLGGGNPIVYDNYSVHVDLDKLCQEMEEIMNDTEYELMNGRFNSSEGNEGNKTHDTSSRKKSVQKTTSVSNKPVAPTKNIGSLKGIGQYAKALFTRLVQQGKLTSSQIAVLKNPNYCRETFGIGSFAVLVDANTTYDKSRYYKHDPQIPFVICNNWHKRNWEKLQEWQKHNSDR